MNDTKKFGITSNVLKILVIIIMIIDHIGMYMCRKFTYEEYYLLRSIGRMAMPVFAFLLVQGFFYTKDLKKFIYRIFCIAIIAQITLFIMGFINETKYNGNITVIYTNLNVLFSYTLSLLLITAIDRKQIIHKLSEEKNFIIRINMFVLILVAYLKLNIEFGLRIPFLFLEMYAIEKLFMNNGKLLHKREFHGMLEKIKYKVIYLVCITIAFASSLIFLQCSTGCKYAILASIILIGLYNGNRGKKNKLIQYGFYAIYPLQHLVLFILAVL